METVAEFVAGLYGAVSLRRPVTRCAVNVCRAERLPSGRYPPQEACMA